SEHDAEFLARLRGMAEQWEASARAEGLLWRDQAAEEASAWLAHRRAERGAGAHLGLSKREERYLLAVVALAGRARRRRRQIVAALFAAISAVALAVSLLAVRASREAVQARNATRMAVARELSSDPTTALAILREIEPPTAPRGWPDLARHALHRGLAH